ncbi:MAG: hypothetical protein RIG62_12290 [Cyclobacteriaceae bacterium]
MKSTQEVTNNTSKKAGNVPEEIDGHNLQEAYESGRITEEELEMIKSGLDPIPRPLGPIIPFPFFYTSSGLYEWSFKYPTFPLPQPLPPFPPLPEPGPLQPGGFSEEGEPMAEAAVPIYPFFQREELRLDIDGRYPLMKVSGTIYTGISLRIHWIANLTKVGANTYSGDIFYKDGNTTWLPHTNVRVQVTKSFFAAQRKVTITFIGRGTANRTRTYLWKSAYYHPVDFEYDVVEGTSAVTQINTGDHPNRPASLSIENLSIETVFRRAGFQVTTSPQGGVPITGAGANATWSDMEMHDAMQIYWSHFANMPQWKMWVLFASLHDTGSNLGGIMFDSIGLNHRQGTALFNDSFIKNAPAGDANPDAWVKRMKFWTACHEMGHAFNLAHSWQKSLGTPWIPLANETEARSFMNYPYFVTGGETAFFADFEFRFSDNELIFMRHAPERFVQMGNADWFDHHGFEQANVLQSSPFQLEVRLQRRTLEYFEFMEPVVAELKLTNRSNQPLIVDEKILEATDEMTVIIQKRGGTAKQWHPFAQYCYHSDKKVLTPGESVYASLNIASGIHGWNIAEPGMYTVQVAMHRDDEDIVSNQLQVRIAPPRSYEEEFVAQDFFSEDVGRVLAFQGTHYLDKANDTLREVADQFANRRVAHHALLALGNPLTRDYKLLNVKGDPNAIAQEPDKMFKTLKAKPDEARQELNKALLDDPGEAADTLGHIEYRQVVEQYSAFLADKGDSDEAASTMQKAEKTLAKRGVLESVLNDMESQRKQYATKKSGKK